MKTTNANLVASIFLFLSTAIRSGSAHKDEPQLDYANHVFNAIHSSMRQFGSSLNHNGMSLFIATVPEDTEFYHGTSSPEPVRGTEWLAFEPEHALYFARGRMGRPPEHGGPSKNGPIAAETAVFNAVTNDQNPVFSSRTEEQHGYLHTYRTKHPLRLLYLDGQSAAKSDKGTLDVQDLVLLHSSPPPSPPPQQQRRSLGRPHATVEKERRPGGPMEEAERALGLCRVAATEWGGLIDGILRMEGGFEIILCDFERHLDPVGITQSEDRGGGPPGHSSGGERFNYYESIAARYDDIGGGRVTLDYNHYVSLFTFPDAIYFDRTGRPRVDNSSTEAISDVKQAVKEMVFHTPSKGKSINWQAIADTIVTRYAKPIQRLASGSISNISAFQTEANRALRPFIDYGDRNRTAEIERCAQQFLPSLHKSHSHDVSARAILKVTYMICKTLKAAEEVDTLNHGLSLVHSLKSWLAWTDWKKCRGCNPFELCFLPIWPVGSVEDFEHPRCVSEIPSASGGYWHWPGPAPLEGDDSPRC